MAKVLAVTLGDRYGVGPELVARLVADFELPPEVCGVVVGDPHVFTAGQRAAGVDNRLPEVAEFGTLSNTDTGKWQLLSRPVALATAPMGQMSPDSGREMLDTLGFLAGAAKAGTIGGIVYAPLNKQALKAAGHAAGDELDFFNHALPASGLTGEINILGSIWTSRVTSHVPLKDVAALITPERAGAGIDLLSNALRRSGLKTPRLALAALNPHAGEGGAFGREEIDVLVPAIEAAHARGIHVEGPYPSDTIFPRALGGAIDGIVTMFHDQGQIALKLIGLGKGITLLAGFPVPIATPGHGTAYDIAGTGKARPDGLFAAARLVATMMTEGTDG